MKALWGRIMRLVGLDDGLMGIRGIAAMDHRIVMRDNLKGLMVKELDEGEQS